MDNPNANETGKRLTMLRGAIGPFMSDRVNSSSMYVDLADIYEISSWYVKIVDEVLSSGSPQKEDVFEMLVGLETQIIRHLSTHIQSLVKSLPRAIACVDD